MLLSLYIMQGCSQKANVETQTAEVTKFEQRGVPQPPPPSIDKLKPITLKKWFFDLCDREKPKKADVAYQLGLFQTDKMYAITLAGSKVKGMESASERTKRDSEPLAYYPLAKDEYTGLQLNGVLDKMKSQLKQFASTSRFKRSSLAKAPNITIRFDDNDVLKLK